MKRKTRRTRRPRKRSKTDMTRRPRTTGRTIVPRTSRKRRRARMNRRQRVKSELGPFSHRQSDYTCLGLIVNKIVSCQPQAQHVIQPQSTTNIRTPMCKHCLETHIHSCVACIRACMCVCVCMCACVHACMCSCAHVCMYIL